MPEKIIKKSRGVGTRKPGRPPKTEPAPTPASDWAEPSSDVDWNSEFDKGMGTISLPGISPATAPFQTPLKHPARLFPSSTTNLIEEKKMTEKLICHDHHGNPHPTPAYHKIFDSYDYPREWQIISKMTQPVCHRYCETALKCEIACLITDNEIPF